MQFERSGAREHSGFPQTRRVWPRLPSLPSVLLASFQPWVKAWGPSISSPTKNTVHPAGAGAPGMNRVLTAKVEAYSAFPLVPAVSVGMQFERSGAPVRKAASGHNHSHPQTKPERGLRMKHQILSPLSGFSLSGHDYGNGLSSTRTM
jgi:hypothetical protein